MINIDYLVKLLIWVQDYDIFEYIYEYSEHIYSNFSDKDCLKSVCYYLQIYGI